MSKLEIFLANWLAQRIVRQGNHQKRITQFYRILGDQARTMFNEDNHVTLNSFMRECFDKAESDAERDMFLRAFMADPMNASTPPAPKVSA